MLPTMAGVVLLVFFLFNWVGGDPAYLLAGKMADAGAIENIRRQLGTDQPYTVQLWIFVKQILTFDFGNAWSTGEPVSHIIASRLGPSLTVLIPLTVLETVFGIALALAIAFVRGSLTDRAVMVACTVGMSLSILVYIIVFQYVFAYQLGLFPVQGWGNSLGENLLKYALLPIIIGLAVSIAPTLRLYRSFVLDEAGQDYVRTARAKGLSERRIVWVHVLRNAAIPMATFAYLSEHLPDPAGHRLYLDRGTDTLDALYGPSFEFGGEVIRDRGYTDANYMERVFPGTDHSEKAWSARVDIPLLFLLARPRP